MQSANFVKCKVWSWTVTKCQSYKYQTFNAPKTASSNIEKFPNAKFQSAKVAKSQCCKVPMLQSAKYVKCQSCKVPKLHSAKDEKIQSWKYAYLQNFKVSKLQSANMANWKCQTCNLS